MEARANIILKATARAGQVKAMMERTVGIKNDEEEHRQWPKEEVEVDMEVATLTKVVMMMMMAVSHGAVDRTAQVEVAAAAVMVATATLVTLNMETEAAVSTSKAMEEEEAMIEMAVMAVVVDARADLAQDRVVINPSILGGYSAFAVH